jgi:hypothetical protein
MCSTCSQKLGRVNFRFRRLSRLTRTRFISLWPLSATRLVSRSHESECAQSGWRDCRRVSNGFPCEVVSLQSLQVCKLMALSFFFRDATDAIIPVKVQPGTMKLPSSLETPIILIGPGESCTNDFEARFLKNSLLIGDPWT